MQKPSRWMNYSLPITLIILMRKKLEIRNVSLFLAPESVISTSAGKAHYNIVGNLHNIQSKADLVKPFSIQSHQSLFFLKAGSLTLPENISVVRECERMGWVSELVLSGSIFLVLGGTVAPSPGGQLIPTDQSSERNNSPNAKEKYYKRSK